ncbi:MAG: hypothetical protein NT014_01145 [Candidatus Omnitrophica bacterium]|nr:hypothetical protein [Candidatus Omnitrophota bacterium]
MKIAKLILFGVLVLVALLLVLSVGPSGLYYDDAGCLHAGKFFLSHPGSLLSFKIPEVLKHAPQFERIPWIYYRPIERIIWAFCFFVFGPNTIMIGLLQKLLFLLSLLMLYKLGRLFLGQSCGVIAVIIFMSILVPYGLLVFHTWLATQFGLLFLLAGIYFTAKGFVDGKMPLLLQGTLFIFLSWLTRESNIYISLPVIFVYIGNYLCSRGKTELRNKNIRFVCIALLLGIVVYAFILFVTSISGFVGMGFHKFAIKNFVPNLNFYAGEIFSNLNSLFIVICLGLAVIFKDRLQWIGLIWALASLIPLLFSINVSKTYLFDFFVGCALFCGSGVSLLIKECFKRNRLGNNYWHKSLDGGDDKVVRLYFLLIIILATLFFSSAVKNFKELQKTKFYAHTKLVSREERLKYLKNLPKQESVFVPNLKAKEFYGALADVINREDIKIRLVVSWNDLQELITGDNLLKNAGFEDGFGRWEFKGKNPGLVKIVDKYGFDGERSLLVDASFLPGGDYDLIDCGQLFSVTAGQAYVFGGIVKLLDFREGIRFEISAPAGSQEGYWQTDIKSGTNSWQVLFNSFTPLDKTQEKLFFYAVRSANLIRGKASIDGVFVYKTKKPILAYD